MALTKVNSKLIQYAPKRNFIINGDMKIWQRGTSLTGLTGTTGTRYLADRFFVSASTDAVITYNKSGTPPTGFTTPMACLFSTADASVGAGQWILIGYYVEGYDYNYLKNQQCVLSFWCWTSISGTYAVVFKDNTSSYSYVAPYFLPSGVWTKVEIPITFNSPGGTFDTTNGVGLVIYWILACGSTYYTSNLNQWTTGNVSAPSNIVNAAATTNAGYYLTGVQLEIGDKATDFEFRSQEEELRLCQRYYEKSYQLAAAPGAANEVPGMIWDYLGVDAASTVGAFGSYQNFRVEKRATPGITYYSPATGTAGKAYLWSNSTDYTVTSSNPNTKGFFWAAAHAAIAGHSFGTQWTARCELGEA